MAGVRHSGLYRRIVEFQQNNPIQKGAGKADNYTTLLKIRGYLINKGGSRSIVAGQIIEANRYDLYIRVTYASYKKLAANINASTKVISEGKVYTISNWERVDDKDFELHFVLNVI